MASAAGTPIQPGRIDIEPDLSGRRVDRGRQAHADADHGVVAGGELVEELLDELGGQRDGAVGRRTGIQADGALAENCVVEVGDGDPQVRVVDVDADGEPGSPAEGDPYDAAAALGHLRQRHQTLALEVADDVEHRGAGQPAAPREVGLARRAFPAQHLDDPLAVGLAQRLRGTRLPPPAHSVPCRRTLPPDDGRVNC